MMSDFAEPPICIRREINCKAIVENNPIDSSIFLGSFWPNDYSSYQSLLVKSFKACNPHSKYHPYFLELCDYYCKLILKQIDNKHFDYVVRILGSSETKPDSNCPLHLLSQKLSDSISSTFLSEIFYKSSERSPMRYVKRLSGKDALQYRLQYISSDLYMQPKKLNGSVLLLDDIANTGASAMVYADALKNICGVNEVISINLAITRFGHGKDGKGMIALDLSDILIKDWAEVVLVDTDGIYHKNEECSATTTKTKPAISFVAEKQNKACVLCFSNNNLAYKKKWWQIF